MVRENSDRIRIRIRFFCLGRIRIRIRLKSTRIRNTVFDIASYWIFFFFSIFYMKIELVTLCADLRHRSGRLTSDRKTLI